MSSKKELNVQKIIERAKECLGIKTDIELANILNINQSAVSAWKRRGNINLNSIITVCPNVSLDWLIYGEGTPYGNPKPEFDPHDESKRISQMINELVGDMPIDKKRYIAEYIEREKLFWKFKEKIDRIDDYGILRKAG